MAKQWEMNTLGRVLYAAGGGDISAYDKLKEDSELARQKAAQEAVQKQIELQKWQFEQEQQAQKDGYFPMQQYANNWTGGNPSDVQSINIPGKGIYARTYSQKLADIKQQAEIDALNAGAKYHNAMANSPFVNGNIPEGFEVKSYDAFGRPMVSKSASVVAKEEADAKAMADEAVRQTKLSGLNDAINFFDKKIGEIPVGSGLPGRLQGLGLEAQAATQMGKYGASAAAYKADLEGMRSQIARGLGEVGNLAENEQKYAVRLLPNLTDNAETRIKKMQNFREYVESRTQRRSGQVKDNKPSEDNDPLGIRK